MGGITQQPDFTKDSLQRVPENHKQALAGLRNSLGKGSSVLLDNS